MPCQVCQVYNFTMSDFDELVEKWYMPGELQWVEYRNSPYPTFDLSYNDGHEDCDNQLRLYIAFYVPRENVLYRIPSLEKDGYEDEDEDNESGVKQREWLDNYINEWKQRKYSNKP